MMLAATPMLIDSIAKLTPTANFNRSYKGLPFSYTQSIGIIYSYNAIGIEQINRLRREEREEEMSEEALVHAKTRSHSIVYCAAAIACMAVTAWVTVPIGPVPLSLSPLAIFFTLFALKPRNAFIAICGYVMLGAVGLPIFTGFRGGIGAVFGPTGGFIMGFVIGACIALPIGQLLAKRKAFASDATISLFGSQVKKGFLLRNLVVGIIFAAVYYIFGWMWLMVAGQLSAGAAFVAAVAPFVIPDLLKMLLAVFLAQAVGAALRR